MHNQGKTCTENQWASSSLSSCNGCSCGKKKKTETDNQWVSTTKTGDSGCGCK